MLIVPEVDLHCHLLPDWDDGPRALDESLAMAARAQAMGLKQVVVTPHVGRTLGARPLPPAHEIPPATAQLQQEIRDAGIDLELVSGAELTLDSTELSKRLSNEPWLTVGGKSAYILIESTFGSWPAFGDQMLYQLSLAGVTPIIAHPERLPDVQRNINLLDNAINQGALLQVTAKALLASEDRAGTRCSLQLLKAGKVALIASDAHNSKGTLPGEVVDVVCEAVGEEWARQILVDNPRAVVTGGAVLSFPDATSREENRQSLLGRLLSRLKS
jgi:protein-tyrosine phosphatase